MSAGAEFHAGFQNRVRADDATLSDRAVFTDDSAWADGATARNFCALGDDRAAVNFFAENNLMVNILWEKLFADESHAQLHIRRNQDVLNVSGNLLRKILCDEP